MKKVFLYLLAFILLPSFAFAYAFTRDLTIGSTGQDVIELQNILISEGFLNIPVGVSKGYFGALTQLALQKYQAAHDISPAVGYFGPKTRVYFNTPPASRTLLPGETNSTSVEISNNTVSQKQFFGEEKTETSEKAPKITKISVSSAKATDRITVSGENFGSKVTIYTSIGILKNKKVNNNSVFFNLSEIVGNVSEASGMPVTFSVGNSNGISSTYGRIVIE